MNRNAWTEDDLKRWMRADAHRFLRPDWRRFWPPRSRMDDDLLYRFYERTEHKYRPDQARDSQGRWIDEVRAVEGQSPSARSSVEEILRTARQIAATGRIGYQKCLDLCVPLLERFQPAGSDRNQWDFRRCLSACLGR